MVAPILDEKTKKWTYPDGWTEEARARWEGIQGRKIAEARRLADAEKAREAAESSPEALIAVAQIEADEAQRRREAAERSAAGEAMWLKARAQFGDRVARIDSDEGDVFILAASNDVETTATKTRAQNLENAAMAAAMSAAGGSPGPQAMMSAKLKGLNDALGAWRDAILAKLMHPARARAEEVLSRKPMLWEVLYNERDRMISGLRVEEGKGFAP